LVLKKKLLLLGLGYQAFNYFAKQATICFKLGFSHTVILYLPNKKISLSIFKCKKKNINIYISGNIFSDVCNVANKISCLKSANAYKEIGFYYKNQKKRIKMFKKK